jgi:hypothetical protein
MRFLIAVALVHSLSGAITAHPGTGIVVDRKGNVYLVDMVSGIWRADIRGVLVHVPGPGFHWLALDEDDRLLRATLPSGSAGDIVRLGASPTALLSSDVPVASGPDGSLYYPTHGGSRPIQIIRIQPSGQSSVVATIAAGGVRELNGLAVGRDGSIYYTENAAVRRIDARGEHSTVAERVAPPNCKPIAGFGAAERPLLRGLAVDSTGGVYAAATGCSGLIRITPDGRVSTVVQSEGEWSPTGVALFGRRIYVLEFLGAASDDRRAMVPRVRVIEPDGSTFVLATVHRP